VLGVVGVKLLIEDLVVIGPIASLAIIALLFAVGIVASLVADRRDPDAERKQQERAERTLSSEGDGDREGEDSDSHDGADSGADREAGKPSAERSES